MYKPPAPPPTLCERTGGWQRGVLEGKARILPRARPGLRTLRLGARTGRNRS
eukprot:CAMPEP_0177470126 /NCGR_PEP_ID=MMETSP0369-20130122/20028_1 /TAXON_ID=447022 ORGANISM="Scrippsiella hangoei-like, Strain SHHI-4" /NCGR_SAMPLE_ID=MMETSP0369 /ASSEMBLY_ACC=CAM_ASM_000364 /LENGTH=51 /DNA_ID=CAMNT_0018944551 /DNA_START=295 /DNA_END=447 /DNA_ORIENTATION=+